MKKRSRWKIIHITLLAITTLFFSMLPLVNSVIIEPGFEYNIGNETYQVNQAMNFSQIRYTDTYIIFNNTGINITAPDNILITLRNLNGSTSVASINDELFEFEVLLDSGTTTMSISGFSLNESHAVYKDAAPDTIETSNGTGCIDIIITSGASNIYTIYRGTMNNLPNAPVPTPADNSSVPSTFSLIKVLVSDSDNDTLNVSFYWPDGSLMGTSLNNLNNSYATISIAVIPGTRYRWYVIVNDSIGETRGPTTGNWTFTVKEGEEPDDEDEEPYGEPDWEEEDWGLWFYLSLLVIVIAIMLIIIGIIMSIRYEGLHGLVAIMAGMIIFLLLLINGIIDDVRKNISSVIDPNLLVFVVVAIITVSIIITLYYERKRKSRSRGG